MRKKVMSCLLAGIMTVSLAACSGGGVSSNDASKDSGKSSADTEVGVEQTAKPQRLRKTRRLEESLSFRSHRVPSHRI